MKTTYEETLDFLFNSLPAYHRIGAAAYKADLSNTEASHEVSNTVALEDAHEVIFT